jgi:hypothetical protein
MTNRTSSFLLALLPLVVCAGTALPATGCGSATDSAASGAGALEDDLADAGDAGTTLKDSGATDGGATDGSATDAGTTDAGASDAGATDGGQALTWSSIYAEAFAPGTPGHCGNSGCHETTNSGFACGTTAATCLSGMIAKGLLSTTDPTASTLGNTASSPLRWVSTSGVMPADNKTAEPALGADIEAWIKAGAPGITAAGEAH